MDRRLRVIAGYTTKISPVYYRINPLTHIRNTYKLQRERLLKLQLLLKGKSGNMLHIPDHTFMNSLNTSWEEGVFNNNSQVKYTIVPQLFPLI